MHTSAFYTYLSMNRWFGVTLDWTITVYSAICVFSFIIIDDGEARCQISGATRIIIYKKQPIRNN